MIFLFCTFHSTLILLVSQSVPILDLWGPYAKLCRRQGGGCGERMDETYLSVFHSRNSLFRSSVHFQLIFFFLKQETV